MPEYFFCDDGWYDIIFSVLNICNYHADRSLKNFKFVQIKEKFAGLRMYNENSDEFIAGVVKMAEDFSYKICEVCGKPGFICTNKRIVKTLCKEDAEKLSFEKYEK